MRPRELIMPSVLIRTHFTRASETASALENKLTILKQVVVRGAPDDSRRARPAVSNFDAPFSERGPRSARGEIGGAAIRSGWRSTTGMLLVWALRPVIYLPRRGGNNCSPQRNDGAS